MTHFVRSIFAVSIIIIAACSSGNQILPVTPKVELSNSISIGAGRTLYIQVYDERSTDVVGYRDPNNKATVITSSPEMLDNIREKVEQAYTELGFELIETKETVDIVLEIRLTELSYQRQSSGGIKDLRTGATFVANSVMNDRVVDGTYRDGQTKDTIVKPSFEENSKILNRHLDAALSKLIADTRLVTDDW